MKSFSFIRPSGSTEEQLKNKKFDFNGVDLKEPV